jgi:SPP1 family predicted phage head-tail adaptor
MGKPGKLDQRITFEAFSEVADGGGGTVKTWAQLASNPTVWARVQASSGGERFDDGRTTATTMTAFWVRNRSDVTELDRILWGGVYYNIRNVMRQGVRDMYVKIIAERGAPTLAEGGS